MISYSGSRVDKYDDKPSAKSQVKASYNGYTKLNYNAKDLLLSKVTSQTTSASQLIDNEGYNSPISNLSVAQIENLLLKYASQNQKLSKQRHALFQKNCQLVTELKKIHVRKNSVDNQSSMLFCDIPNKNEHISSDNKVAENFSISHAINRNKQSEQISGNKGQQLSFEPQKSNIGQAYSSIYINDKKIKKQTNFVSEIIASSQNTNSINFDKSKKIQKQKQNPVINIQSGKTIPKNVYYTQKQLVPGNKPMHTTRAKNCNSFFEFDAQKTFIEKKSFIAQKDLEQNFLKPSLRQQVCSPINVKDQLDDSANKRKLVKNRENVKQGQQANKPTSILKKKGVHLNNLMDLDMKIKKLKGQNMKLRTQIL